MTNERRNNFVFFSFSVLFFGILIAYFTDTYKRRSLETKIDTDEMIIILQDDTIISNQSGVLKNQDSIIKLLNDKKRLKKY